MSLKIKFGTDGWRARIADDYTFENCRRCAQGFATYLLKQGKKGERVIVGYDKRFHSENFAALCAEVLAGNGFKVLLTDGATPTPVISYAVVDKKAVGAINITASHNPATDNGFKVRDASGGAIDPDGLIEIEAAIPDDISGVVSLPIQDGLANGSIEYFDASVNYIEHLKDLIDLQPIRDAGLKVVVDSMWGNGGGWFTRLLGGGKTEIIEIHDTRNPIYPEMKRPEPIPPNVNVGLERTVRESADVCLIMDGDADRCGMGTETGEFLNQLQVMALLTLYILEVRKETGAIVKTLSTTTMLNKLAAKYNCPLFETGVGFKYVAPKFTETNAIIGGEESGGYAFRGNVPERDGILANLYFLDFIVKTGKKPSELLAWLFEIVGAHYYKRVDTMFQGNSADKIAAIKANYPQTLGGIKVVNVNTADGFKFEMEDGGWMLIRFSGTEPIIRVYTETTNPNVVDAILADGLKTAGIE